MRRSAPRSSTSRCRAVVETFIRPPASVCNSQPGVRVWSSSASRSTVASSSGRGAGCSAAATSGEVVLAQGHQPVGQRGAVGPRQGPTLRVQLVERRIDGVRIVQVVGDRDGWAQRGVQRLGHGGEPDRVELAVQRPAPEQVRGQLQEPVTLGGGLGLLQTGGLALVDPVPDVLDDRVRFPVTVRHHRVRPPARSSSPRSPTRTFRAARQIADVCDHDSHRSDSPASVAGMRASISTAPSTSRASAWVQRTWCCSHTCRLMPPVSSARSSSWVSETSSRTSSPMSRSRVSAISVTRSSRPATAAPAAPAASAWGAVAYGAAVSAARDGHWISVRGATNMATPYEPGVTSRAPNPPPVDDSGRFRAPPVR